MKFLAEWDSCKILRQKGIIKLLKYFYKLFFESCSNFILSLLDIDFILGVEFINAMNSLILLVSQLIKSEDGEPVFAKGMQ